MLILTSTMQAAIITMARTAITTMAVTTSTTPHSHSRSFPEIRSILLSAPPSVAVRSLSLTAFELLAQGGGRHSWEAGRRSALP